MSVEQSPEDGLDPRPAPTTLDQPLALEPVLDQPVLDQKVALVTSSAPGICADTAMQLARAGAKVIVCGRNANQGLATVKQIRREGGRATFVLADIAIAADIQAVIDETIATYGRLDILFNNVSNSYARDSVLIDVSESIWDRLVEPLLKGTFFCCQYALPFLQQSSGGTIINLIEKTPQSHNDSVLTICQGGVLALTSAIAQQFPPHTVTANLIWAISAAESTNPADAGMAGSSSALPSATSSLLLSPVLTGPPTENRPFADVAEAVMYLACHGSTLHGAALLIRP